MIRNLSLLVAVAAIGALVATPAYAPPGGKGGSGSAASSKAVFSNNPDGIMFAQVNTPCPGTVFLTPTDAGCSAWMKLFDLPEAIKTSHTGALEAVVSMECALWTDNEVKVTLGDDKSSGARAGIEVRVKVDDIEMEPKNIVFCDRLQYIDLTIPALEDSFGGAVVCAESKRAPRAASASRLGVAAPGWS